MELYFVIQPEGLLACLINAFSLVPPPAFDVVGLDQ